MASAKSVMLAAGGTGGHLFPALALAQEFGRRGILVDLVTDMRGDRYGADFPARAVYRVPSATLAGRSPLAAAATGWMLLRGIAAAFKLLGEVRPGALVGFGGYPAFPPLVAAKLRQIPTALHEQNAVLGRANRMLATRVTAIATSFEPTKHLEGPALGRVRLTGNPVRDLVITWSAQDYQAPASEGPFSLLVFGGSQGARFFSDTLPPALTLLSAELRAHLFVVQQCREEDLARVEAAYRPPACARIWPRFSPTFPRRWPRRTSSSAVPEPRPWPSSRSWAGPRSSCRCRMRSTTISCRMRDGLPNWAELGALSRRS